MSRERLLYSTGAHWIVIVAPWSAGLLFGMLSFAEWLASRSQISLRMGAAQGYGELATVYFSVTFLCFLGGWVRFQSVSLAVTNERVLARQGFLVRKTFGVPLARLAAMTVEENLLGQILGYGTVVLRGTSGGPERFRAIRKPLAFRTRTQEEWNRYFEDRRLGPASGATGAPPTSPSP